MANKENKTQLEEEEKKGQEQEGPVSEEAQKESEVSEKEAAEAKITELNDKYLRLYSEFENYRRRTSKERLELMKNAGEDILTDLLPVIDDFERAIKSFDSTENVEALKQGIDLVHNKFVSTLKSKGLQPFKSIEETFDPEIHEAVTKIPAPSKKLKGKVVDEIEKGYKLNEKVIRYAKVVVGE
ncbi:nucleotide exchange factor GrpE [bacterium]|nr:nucleotide exchange factor GrpE [bacterium]